MRLLVHACARDEDAILVEWVAHHLVNIGASLVCVYDDGSARPVSSLLDAELPKHLRDRVEVVRLGPDFQDPSVFSTYDCFDSDLYAIAPTRQAYAAAHFARLRAAPGDDDWCLFCDCDEFLWLQDGVSVSDLVAEAEGQGLSCVSLRWLMYGSSHHVDPPSHDCLVVDAMRRHASSYEDVGKSLVKMAAFRAACEGSGLADFDNHLANPSLHSRLPPTFHPQDRAHLAHYHKSGGARGFLRRKLRPRATEPSPIAVDVRGAPSVWAWAPATILKILLAGEDNDAEENLMEKYRGPLRVLLGRVSTEPPAGAFVEALFHGGRAMHYDREEDPEPDGGDATTMEAFEGQGRVTRTLLRALADDELLRYCLQSELLPPMFSAAEYRRLYPDIGHLTDTGAINHYLAHGVKEGRLPGHADTPAGFDETTYKAMNPDLATMTDGEATVHFVLHGARESRRW